MNYQPSSPYGSWPYGSSAYPGGDSFGPPVRAETHGPYPSAGMMPSSQYQGGQMTQGGPPSPGYQGAQPPGVSYAGPGGQGALPYAGATPSAVIPTTEQSFIENILRLNLEKVASVYCTFENNKEWNAKVFRGEVEAAGRDHVIINDTNTGTRYLIPMVYVDYVTFQGPMNYSYPYE
ncbi:spore germination protein Q [Scopulibacillus daqui]|uniref:Spore germination protein Q n=1 Tax=Scopulibacillus daqui TaxID=1469162 RepID=A0ABS2PZE1_9BACL|nr:spore coat protein GerQ [Scopulibacillus daqui]MBM7645419.1 spore germination protein Q [Scopulibacillus daqui]